MTIQVTLNANEFQRTGEYNGRQYTSLRVNYISNGRVYFTTRKDQISWSSMAKQMKLDNGNVIISFGKNDKLIIGSYVDTEAVEATPVNEVSEQVEEVKETVSNEVTEPTKEETKQNKTNNESNQLKVSKQMETIIVRGYMGKVEEREGKRIEHNEFNLYLVKSSKHWTIYEKNTGKSISGLMNTKNAAMDKLQEFLTNHYDKFKESIENTINKDGYISDYKIGSWIRSA